MDESIFPALENFDRLWLRVTGRDARESCARHTATECPRFLCRSSPSVQVGHELTPVEKALCPLISGAARRQADLLELSEHLKNERARLSRLAAGEERRLCLLQAEYFLLSGNTLALPRGGSRKSEKNIGTLERLRRLCSDSENAAAALSRAAELSGEGSLSETLFSLASEQTAAAAELKSLLMLAFGYPVI